MNRSLVKFSDVQTAEPRRGPFFGMPIRRAAPFPLFFIRRKLFGQKIPLLASFKLTYRCNLCCLACPFHRRAEEERAHMSWSVARASLDALKHAGALIVVFEGGEPFLWRDGRHDLRDLIDYAKGLFPRVAVTTNGTFPLDVPADVLWVSLDGLREVHNRLRSGSFDKVWANLRTSRHRRLFVHFTINRENQRDIRPLLKQLQEIPAFRGMTVQLFYPYGQGEAPLALSEGERKEVLEEVVEMKKQGLPILNSAGRLRAMIQNDWRCHDDILINVDPDGAITRGCYVKSRGRINCQECGFSPVSEASGALDLLLGSLRAGWSIFLK
ncbi:MAG: Antilisterial bacteriocin subtilosin biosynthesis protein AlbA [Syntrophus sp. PtaU1.Bin208]|nr:MAG: Antilisterial bacteriocin subtilosin biosynthesis protein AlbA [Syntrophus sp. PtaU1.Bin208]